MPSTYITSLHSETPRHGTGSANATWKLAGDTPESGRRTQQGEPPARFNPSCCQLPTSVFQAKGNRMQRSKFYVEKFWVVPAANTPLLQKSARLGHTQTGAHSKFAFSEAQGSGARTHRAKLFTMPCRGMIARQSPQNWINKLSLAYRWCKI